MAYSTPVIEKFLDLRAQGWSFARIAKELKVSIRTLIRWQGKYPGYITEREFIDCQEIIDENHLSVRALIEKKAKLADRLDGTLAQWDLSKETLSNILKMRNEVGEELQRMIRNYKLYAGRSRDPTVEEYRSSLIGVQ
jgi:hypothetical protein